MDDERWRADVAGSAAVCPRLLNRQRKIAFAFEKLIRDDGFCCAGVEHRATVVDRKPVPEQSGVRT